MELEDMVALFQLAEEYICKSLQTRVLGFMVSLFSVEKMMLERMKSGPEKVTIRQEQFTRDTLFMKSMHPYFNMRVFLEKREKLYKPQGCIFHCARVVIDGDQTTFLCFLLYERWIAQVLVNLEKHKNDPELHKLFDEHDVEYLIWMYNTISSCVSCNQFQLPCAAALFEFLFQTKACVGNGGGQETVNPGTRFMDAIRKLVIAPDAVKRDEATIFEFALRVVHESDPHPFGGRKVSESFKIFILEFLFVLKHQLVNRRLFPEPEEVVEEPAAVVSMKHNNQAIISMFNNMTRKQKQQ
jgi:hypothetical protein